MGKLRTHWTEERIQKELDKGRPKRKGGRCSRTEDIFDHVFGKAAHPGKGGLNGALYAENQAYHAARAKGCGGYSQAYAKSIAVNRPLDQDPVSESDARRRKDQVRKDDEENKRRRRKLEKTVYGSRAPGADKKGV